MIDRASALRRGLHNCKHPLYASPPVKTGSNTTILIVHSLDIIRLRLNQLNVAVSKRVPPSECLRNERILQAKAKYARKEVQLLMQVWVVIICFGVIAMCSKYKRVLSISIISGQIIHWFIYEFKRVQALLLCFEFACIQWMTASGADLQNS